MSLTNAVSGTASSKPITPHNQPQKRIPTVAAIGPILTRVAINLGVRRFADTRCNRRIVRVMMTNGPAVLNCRMAAARGSASEKISPRNGSGFKRPLAIPKGIAPFIPMPNNISVVATAIMDPTMRLPATKPRIISFRFVTNRAVSIFELKRA